MFFPSSTSLSCSPRSNNCSCSLVTSRPSSDLWLTQTEEAGDVSTCYVSMSGGGDFVPHRLKGTHERGELNMSLSPPTFISKVLLPAQLSYGITTGQLGTPWVLSASPPSLGLHWLWTFVVPIDVCSRGQCNLWTGPWLSIHIVGFLKNKNPCT